MPAPAPDVGTLLATIERLLAANRVTTARRLLELLSREAPADPRVIALRARLFPPVEAFHSIELPSSKPDSLPVPPMVSVEARPAPQAIRPRAALLLIAALLVLTLVFVLIRPLLRTPSQAQLPLSAATPCPLDQCPPASATPLTQPSMTPTRSITVAATTAVPGPTATTAPLAAGNFVLIEGWQISLARNEFARLLQPAAGATASSPRLVLVLISVANTHSEPRRVPPALISLRDRQGRSYAPVAGASSDYLARYERGVFGDLAYEDAVPAGGGLYSMPLVFEVPLTSGPLVLQIGEHPGGWLISE